MINDKKELSEKIIKYFEDRYNQTLSTDELLRVTSEGSLELIKEMELFYEKKREKDRAT